MLPAGGYGWAPGAAGESGQNSAKGGDGGPLTGGGGGAGSYHTGHGGKGGSGIIVLEYALEVRECVCSAGMGGTPCRVCAQGTYKEELGNAECIACPAGLNLTSPLGSKRITDCDCIPGFTRNGSFEVGGGEVSCSPCAEGTYKGSSTECRRCPANTTSPAASHGRLDCRCVAGFEGEQGGPCLQCSRGTYSQDQPGRNANELFFSLCISCPAGQSTPSAGAGSAGDCACEEGRGFNSVTGECEACAEGLTKPDVGNHTCSACKVCPDGQVESAACTPSAEAKCELSPAGFWAQGGSLFECIKDSTSPRGSSVQQNCSCVAGFFGADGGVCHPCRADSFCPGGATVTACPANSQSAPGAASAADCLCVPGFKKNPADGVSCIECSEGTFCESGSNETECPPHKTSPEGSTNVGDCLCAPGFVDDGLGGCRPCRANFFCVGNASEERCPENAISFAGANSSLACVCDRGFYGENGGSCTQCEEGFWCWSGSRFACAANAGSDRGSSYPQNCTCNPGYFGPEAGPCQACSANTFKDVRGTSACQSCPPNHGTEAAASTSSLDCVCTATGAGAQELCTVTPCGVPIAEAQSQSVRTRGRISSSKAYESRVVVAETVDEFKIVLFNNYASSWTMQIDFNNQNHEITLAAVTSGLPSCPSPPHFEVPGRDERSAVQLDRRIRGSRFAVVDEFGLGLEIVVRSTSRYTRADFVVSWNSTCAAPFGLDKQAGDCKDCELYKNTVDLDCSGCPRFSKPFVPVNTTIDAGASQTCLCDPGYTYNNETRVCDPCPAGMFKPLAGNGECEACPAHATTSGAASSRAECTCPAGMTATGGEDFVCTPCPASTFKALPGNGNCTRCPVNTGTREPGQVSQESCVCAPGSFEPRSDEEPDGTGACELCPEDTFADDFGTLGGCTPCVPNTTTALQTGAANAAACVCQRGFTDSGGSTASGCGACAENTFKNSTGGGECAPCPDNTQSPRGSVHVHQCLCDINFVGDASTGCAPCPANSGTAQPGASVCQCADGFVPSTPPCSLCGSGTHVERETRTCKPCVQPTCPFGTYPTCDPKSDEGDVVCASCSIPAGIDGFLRLKAEDEYKAGFAQPLGWDEDKCEFVCKQGFFANVYERRCCSINEILDAESGECVCAPGTASVGGEHAVCRL